MAWVLGGVAGVAVDPHPVLVHVAGLLDEAVAPQELGTSHADIALAQRSDEILQPVVAARLEIVIEQNHDIAR